MFAFIEGVVEEKEPGRVVLNAGGLGFELSITTGTYEGLPATGGRARLRVVELIREDAHLLVGFGDETERQLFLRLVDIPGIGQKSALAVLSHVGIRELQAAAASNDIARLSKVPGIGKKTAERIAMELRGKMSKGELAVAAANATTGLRAQNSEDNAKLRDVYSALIALGHRAVEAQEILKKVAPRIEPGQGVDDILKHILSGQWR